MTDVKAAITGSVFSLIGINLIGFVGDVFLAFLFGAVGALGGWLVNKLIKRIERYYEKKKEI